MASTNHLRIAANRALRKHNYREALALYEQLCIAGDVQGKVMCGWLIAQGYSSSSERDAAIPYFVSAFEKGSPAAGFYLGVHLIQSGRTAEALQWLEKAHLRHYAPASYRLALAIKNGLFLGREESEADTVMLSAARQGHLLAQISINRSKMLHSRSPLEIITGFVRFTASAVKAITVGILDPLDDRIRG
jgi:TPR repeat protein